MRTFILLTFLALLAFVAAIPITPSAPPLRKRAEQYRLQGLREYEIAQRLTTPISPLDPTSPSDLSLSIPDAHTASPLHTLLSFFSPSTPTFTTSSSSSDDDDSDSDTEGDIPPGSLSSPQMLPSKPLISSSAWSRLCSLIGGRESEFGYEGKEEEIRRPVGGRSWKGSFGGFRR